MKTRSLRNKTRRLNQVDHPESSSDLDLAPSGSMQQNHEQRGETISHSRSATPEMGNTELLHPRPTEDVGSHTQQSTRRHGSEDDCLTPVPNQDADLLLSDVSDSALNPAIPQSLEDSEVKFGPTVGDDSDTQDTTLPWNPDDLSSMQHSTINDGPVSSSSLPASPDPFDQEILILKCPDSLTGLVRRRRSSLAVCRSLHPILLSGQYLTGGCPNAVTTSDHGMGGGDRHF
ncbi:uncharacterized protein LOC133659650 [Entelurus aequoreus]|uniref:uncharacterized protein LOC133659650 n=1 Tax=Entelurus aequoreus TaxID=161455 RepID=UPI002B1D5E34|nr:uncharacterized protein LOC133659650 [Entelurus aequoreus]